MTGPISVTVNGEVRQVPAGVNVTRLLVHLGITPARVAIERNLGILPRDHWDSTDVVPGDRYEIVHLVGGG
jgi:thiazole synthase